MKILAIETSCDETAVAVLEAEGGFENPQFNVLGDALYSQAEKHAKYGGVYPNLAKRLHSQNLIPLLKIALEEATLLNVSTDVSTSVLTPDVKIILEREVELLNEFKNEIPKLARPDIDAIAVTQGPGLEPALWVGLNFAKALSAQWNIPLVPINHMEGHIFSVLLKTEKINDKTPACAEDSAGRQMTNNKKEKDKIEHQKLNVKIEFPALALLISGGHTELVVVLDWLEYEIIGQTRDDAVGEAFDKVARILGLRYPGGPEISRLAEAARRSYSNVRANIGIGNLNLMLPRPMMDSDDYDFSFSGLKTAVLYKTKELGALDTETKQILAREFEDAVVDVLVSKTKKALEEYNVDTLIIGGGVIANKELRKAFNALVEGYSGVTLLIPEMRLTGDNAVMIGVAGYFRALKNEYADATNDSVRAQGNLKLA